MSLQGKTIIAHQFEHGTPLARQVYGHLHDRICALELKPYEMLSEKRISEELGVSRTPVREALARLAEHRLVDILPQRGTFVAPLRVMELERSQFMREGIELALLRRAIAAPDRSGLVERLRNEIRLQVAFCEIGDIDRFYASDEDFHGHFASFADLPFILDEIRRVKMHMDRFRRLMIGSTDSLRAVVEQHERIADAIERGDLANAEEVMLYHLRRVFAHLDDTASRFPHYIEPGSDRLRSAASTRGP